MTRPPHVFSWLLAQHLAGMKPGLMRRLIALDTDCSDPQQWLDWPAARLRSAGAGEELLQAAAEWRRQGDACAAAQRAGRDLDWLQKNGVQLLSLTDLRYPPLLLEIADPPPLLYVWGDLDCLIAPQLAVVGSRRPSRQGLNDANDFAAALAGGGFTITSGLAYGIDAAAHRAALNIGGKTVAVLGSGIDSIYPAANRELAAAISQQGAVISDFPIGTPPRAQHFPSRNRIISGLSLGVLVVEAALQSGSLVTARLAAEQNREVFALPGSIHNPVSRGCNSLIRQGATLVQSAEDIVSELRGWTAPEACERSPTAAVAPAVELGAEEATVFAAVGFQPISLDEILGIVTQTAPEVLATLAELELLGLIENRGGSYVRAAGACAK